jgi:mediator of replication checkpoint protein 1
MDTDTSDSDDNEDDENAYERVKRMLMSGSDKAKPDPEVIPKDKATEIASEDDEDMPVRTNNARRQVLLREKSRTPPMSSPRRMISRASSPGLFVTPDASPVPQKVSRISPAAEDGAPPTKPRHDKDLEERVKRIRAERLAAKEEKRKQERSKKPARITANSGSDSDGESGRRLTQQARPTRRAGKKALEDIAREQQRISRNMQLTHQAKTKKKYGIKDLLPRFGLAQVGSELVSAPAIPTPDASSVVASSDAEAAPEHHTPPTSPPRQEDATLGLEPSASPQLLRQDKGKGRAPESQHVPSNPLVQQTMLAVQKERASARKSVPTEMIELSDSDDDLKVEKPQSRFAVFDKVPQRKQREPSSLLALRHLAHLTSPGKRAPKGRKTMSMAELYSKLGRKAREQAQKERDEKIEELRRRGIHIETEEERERHQLEIEDLVAQLEKTREEDLKLAKLEKEEAKKNGEKRDDLLSSDESEDEDYVGSGEEETVELETEEQVEIELSGSEEEDLAEADDEEEPDEEEEEEQENTNGLLDDAAEESADEEDLETQERKQQEPEEEVDDESPHARVHNRTANRARKVVLDESEESGDESQNKSAPVEAVPLPSQTQAEDPMAAFGFENSSPGLGLTQMFAGTMANLVTGSQQKHALDDAPEQDSLDFLRSLPDTQPGNVPESPSDLLVPNSQMLAYQQDESQISLGVSQLVRSSPAFAQTQLVEEFEPTQDAGFELPRSPAGLAVPPSTVETVMMTVAESPVKKTKGKLHRRKHMANAELSDVDDTPASGSEAEAEKVMEAADAGNAFTVLKKAAKRQKRAEDNFDKKNSLARNAIEEQAEESEDEYAGIGGASDEDSGEEDEELAQMIDTNEVKVDERKIAAYFA